MADVGNEVRVVLDGTTVQYEDGSTRTLRRGAVVGALSDFVASGPDGGEGVEVFTNHPADGRPTLAVVSASRVTIWGWV